MKSKICLTQLFAISFAIILFSCEPENEGGNVTNISSQGSSESHNMGKNCMNCHKSGGSGEGWFTIAGTVYDSLNTNEFPNVTVSFFTGPNETGDLKYIIPGDALGNFFTTQNIDFGDGLYVSVTGDKTTKVMNSKVSVGQCNSCHGSSTGKIWTR